MLGDEINLLNHLTNRAGKMAKRTGRSRAYVADRTYSRVPVSSSTKSGT
jgi:hypothetical protein